MNKRFNPSNPTGVRIFLVWILGFFVLFGVRRSPDAVLAGSPARTLPGVFIPLVLNSPSSEDSQPPIPPPEEAGWLAYLNYYRALAELPAVSENVEWGNGGWLHSRYMVKNDSVGHGEDPQNDWYTPEGDLAARSSNLVASSTCTISDPVAIDLWMQAPFHGLGILDPALTQVGYGSFRDEDDGLQMGAALDILRGLRETPAATKFPIAWPAGGMSVPLTSHRGEYPNPLASCPGYSAPSGLPIILQMGPGDQTPQVTAHAFLKGKTPLENCVFSETSYYSSNRDEQELGRAVLDARDAIILIPRQPLTPGANYLVSLTVDSQEYTWSFSVAEQASQAQFLSSETIIP